MYPSEGDSLPPVKKTFIFGSINPSTAPFYINGRKIGVYKNGAFIAYLPVSEGDFAFNCELQNGATTSYARKIKIRPAPQPRISTGALGLEIVSPSSDMEFAAGDYVNVLALGTPSRKAAFSIKGAAKDVEMTEIPKGSGRYFGLYRVKDSDSVRGAELAVKFKTGMFASGAGVVAKGRISFLNKFSIMETSTDTVILRNGPVSGYMIFLPKGVKLICDGRAGNMRRIRLSACETAWVDDSKVALSNESAFAPQTETGAIRLKKTDTGSSASVYLPEKVPYIAEEKENALRITLYYTKAHTNTVVYDSSDAFLNSARVSQTAENNAVIDFEFAPGAALWGYDVSYGTRALVVDMKKAPPVSGTWPRPLAGLRVVVDPGHSPKQTPPYDGAIGPMGTFEYQVNLVTAYKLKDALAALGAAVYMIRQGTETVQLADRPRLAKEFKGDLYISLHNNAIADGEDPFAQPKGFSVYHYHRHSLKLAAAVHRSYLKNIPLPDEGLRFGDYAVARLTSMPAVLVESAYMILPEQEELLNSPDFQQKLADAVAGGVLDFLKIPPRKVNK
ncbi:MAG: N-acetylmuramoyl-L-alanine amidase [Proteobacteria bacterium]|nr:N-acetylmuramoyl-L-alanine amidase [Pseudomonadota bacterium]